jgi:hypothetical protein
MLRVSIHAGPLRTISRFNRTDWLDIGYRRLKPYADYKIVLFKIGEGAMPPVILRKYPRWSASLWDLAARAMARSLYPVPGDADNEKEVEDGSPQEQVPAAQFAVKNPAFAETLSAVIQHIPNSGTGERQIAAMQIDEHKTVRCEYRAQIEENQQTTRKTEAFEFAPRFLRPAELVMRAALFSMTGSIDEMPPRPVLRAPRARVIDGIEYLDIHKLKEPARTGLIRWLYQQKRRPVASPSAPDGLVEYERYTAFLVEAV